MILPPAMRKAPWAVLVSSALLAVLVRSGLSADDPAAGADPAKLKSASETKPGVDPAVAPAEPPATRAEPGDSAARISPAEAAATVDTREFLRSCGIDDSHFDRLQDGRPINDDENETLMRIMFRMRDFPATHVQRWAARDFDLAKIQAGPEANRGQMFSIRGRVTHVRLFKPLPEVAERFELPHYYQCELQLAGGAPAIVLTETIPKAWEHDQAVDYRASAAAIFLKLAEAEPRPSRPVFLAPRLAWHPPTVLGELGMDVGLLDNLEDQKPLTGRDHETFYRVLAAVKRAKPRALLKAAREELKAAGQEAFSVVPLFNYPQTQRGRLVVLRGVARRVIKIAVDNPEEQARFGLDHYYELALFTDDSQGNPLVFCVPGIPQGMPTGQGAGFGEEVEVAGFFLKSWSYRAQPAEEAPEPRPGSVSRRLAPLLIGQEPVWHPLQKPAPNLLWQGVVGAVFAAAALTLWFVVWQYNRRDEEARRKFRTLHGEGLTKIALDRIDQASPGEDQTDTESS